VRRRLAPLQLVRLYLGKSGFRPIESTGNAVEQLGHVPGLGIRVVEELWRTAILSL
jgi:hypothetical protein